MITINLNSKTIRIQSIRAFDNRGVYIELSLLWMKSPWLPGDAPFGFDMQERSIFLTRGWELLQCNIHGEPVYT